MKLFIKLKDGRAEVMVRRRIRTAVLGVATGVVLLAGLAVFAGTSQAREAAPSGVLWMGDPARGTRVFDGLERAPGTITVAKDPITNTPSFRYETWQKSGDKSRCESRGLRLPNGSVLSLNN